MTSFIPLSVVYAGLAGTVLALIVATATNRWSPRVFFLLALRLAIGWHFLFEGLHKVHSHYAGPTETSRPFSSEPYFKVAPGPFGEMMRKQFGDPEAVIAAKVKAPKEIAPGDFVKLSAEDQAAACPEAVAKELDAMAEATEKAIRDRAEADLKAADAAEQKALAAIAAAEEKGLKEARTGEEKEQVKARAEADRAQARADAETARAEARKRAESAKQATPPLITAAKAAYARWVYGVDGRPTKVKFFTTGEPTLTAPQRLAHLAWLKQEAEEAEARQRAGLGSGHGYDVKKAAEVRTDWVTAEAELAKDANAFVADLKTDLNGGKAPAEEPARSLGQRMDTFTMWFLVAVGGALLAGLFTRVMCVLAAGFLVLTYLTHPPFPWYPLPPNTEGNPLFINKNVIEALALLTIATFPTGRWLGLDALIFRNCCRNGRTADAV